MKIFYTDFNSIYIFDNCKVIQIRQDLNKEINLEEIPEGEIVAVYDDEDLDQGIIGEFVKNVKFTDWIVSEYKYAIKFARDQWPEKIR